MLLVANSLDVPKPSTWPISMTRFGMVPEGSLRGDPIYRIVFAPTCRKLIFGCDEFGEIGAHNRAKHPTIGQKWILEKWISGWQATKMTPAEYERWGPRDPRSGMLIEGPYPSDGIYEHCWTFDSIDEMSGIDHIIALIENGAKRSLSEIQEGNREIDRKAEEQAKAERFMRVREKEPLYGIRPANFAGAPKAVNHKTQRLDVAANELGLPVKRGSVVSMKGPKVNAGI